MQIEKIKTLKAPVYDVDHHSSFNEMAKGIENLKKLVNRFFFCFNLITLLELVLLLLFFSLYLGVGGDGPFWFLGKSYLVQSAYMFARVQFKSSI